MSFSRPALLVQLTRLLMVAGAGLTLQHLPAQDASIQTVDRGVGGGNVGEYSSQEIIGGNPAMAYYDNTENSLKFVRATDAAGTAWGTPLTLDTDSDVGRWCSLAVIGGNPAVSYYDSTNGDLKYVRATDSAGTAWASPVVVTSDSFIGHYSSLQSVNGRPAIAYHHLQTGDVMYVRANDATGTVWGVPVIADAVGGFFTSLRVIAGNPAISYYASTGDDLGYVRALDADGSSWGTPVLVDTTGDVGGYSCLLEVSGNPAISYHHWANGDLKYVRATDATGGAWAAPLTLDSTGSVGQYTSLLLVAGQPAISYFDATNSNLKYVRASDANGTAWGTPVSPATTGSVGQHTSLRIANGNPAISYYDSTNGDLKHLRATDSTGSVWGSATTPDSGAGSGDTGQFTFQIMVNGRPAICYHDNTNGDLKYVRATDARGTSWGVPITLDSTGSAGQHTCMQVVAGNPAISYYDSTNGDLKYIRATDVDGTSWGTPVVLESTGTVGQHTCLQVVNGNPAVSYYSSSSADLKYVRATDASGSSWDTPVTVVSTGQVGEYGSLKVVNGNPAISYYDATERCLKYVRATDTDGGTWDSPVTADRAEALIMSGPGPVVPTPEPSGTYNPLNGVWSPSLGDAWAVGDSGTIVKRVPGSLPFAWTTQTSGTANRLNAIWGSGTTHIWAVGNSGTILKYNGSAWSAQTSGTANHLRGVWGTSATNVWAVGDSNTILRWNGTAWSPQTPPGATGTVLNSVWGTDTNNVWAAGDEGNIFFWNGTSWSDVTPGLSSGITFKGIWAANTSNAWAVGSELGMGVIYYWNGTSWAYQSSFGFQEVTGVWGRDQNNVFATGSLGESYFHITGSWFASPGQTPLRGISGNSTELFVVGERAPIGGNTSLQNVNGRPAICYDKLVNTSGGTLRYVRAGDSDGTSWGTPVTIGNAGLNGSLEIIGGRPAVSFDDSGHLSYVQASHVNGTFWKDPRRVDSATGEYSSLIEISGGAAVSYYDSGKGDLKHVILNDGPDLDIKQPASFLIADGGSRNFGNVTVGNTADLVFTTANSGNLDLVLNGTPKVAVSGTDAGQFTVTAQPSSPVAENAATTFTVRFAPTSAGLKSAALSIFSNDADENPYDINLTGTAVSPAIVNTTAASSVTTTSATLNGTVNANGLSTTVTFEYGLTNAYGSTVAATPSPVTGTAVTAVSAPLASLPQNTTYHFRAKGVSSAGTSYGPDVTFTTTFLPGGVDTSHNADVNGSVLAMATQPDGKVIIGGNFTLVGGGTRNYIARVNADGTLDTGFNPNLDDSVNAIALQADGKILIGGLFFTVGGTTRVSLARLNANGSLDTSFNVSVTGDVYSLAVQPDGRILVGGDFISIGGFSRLLLARVNPNGTTDASFNADMLPGGSMTAVRSIAVLPGGKILAGGEFDDVAGTGQAYLVRLNADSTVDSGFAPVLDGGLSSMLVQADGKVVIAGDFVNVNGAADPLLARLNEDGTRDAGFTGTVDGYVFSMVQQADGKLILGGDFSEVTGSVMRNRIARLLPGGAADPGFDPDADGSVQALVVQADGRVLAGGGFTMIGGVSRNHLARLFNDSVTSSLTTTGTSHVEWLRGGAAPEVSQVTFEASQDGGTVYHTLGSGTRISGGWQLTGISLPSSGLLRARGRTSSGVGNASAGLVEAVAGFPLAGSVDLAFAPAMNSLPATMAVQPDGKILIGGQFTQVNGVPRSYVARLLKDGTLDSAFRSTGSGPNNSVTRLAVQPDGKILIAGSFTQVDGQAKSRIARLNADGGLDTSFDVGAGTGGPLVSAIVPLPDGKILLGGYFSSFNGQAYGGVVRLNASGSVDTSFTANAYGNVHSIARQPDGKIVIGGEQGIFRANANGTVDPGFNVGTAPNNFVLNVAVQADNKILMTGMFTTVGGLARSKIARLNPDGSVESTVTFNPGSGPSGTFLGGAMECLALQADGKILIAGDLTFMDGQARNGIARLNSDGSIESLGSFDIGTGVASTFPGVNGLALDGEGGILIGGAITSVNGTVRSGLARLVNHRASQSLTAPAASTVRWLRSGTLPETNQVSFELSTNAGANWTTLGEGTRTPGGWQLTGQSLPASGYLRARATVPSGTRNGSAGILESLGTFGPLSLPEIAVFDGSSTDPQHQRGDNANPVNLATTVGAGGSQSFTIKNTGAASLSIAGITFEGANPADFSVTTSPAAMVAAGASTHFTVRFNPTTAGAKSATLCIASNVFGTSNPFEIPLRGTAAEAASWDNVAGSLDLGSAERVSLSGSNFGATLEPGENTLGGIQAGTVWMEWTAPYSGWFTIHTAGSQMDTIIGLHDGSMNLLGFNDYSYRSTDLDAFGQPYTSARLNFYAPGGTTYLISVGGKANYEDEGPSTGVFQLVIEPETPEARVESLSLSPSAVDVTSSSDLTTVGLNIGSDQDLLVNHYVDIALLDDETGWTHRLSQSLSPPDLVSGSVTQGAYEKEFNVPRYVKPGQWPVRVSVYGNTPGDYTGWTAQGDDLLQDNYLIPSVTQGALTVINSGPVDETGPTLVSVTGIPPVVDVTGGDVTFDVDITFTDNPSGLGAVFAAATRLNYGIGLNDYLSSGAMLISGNSVSGVYRLPVRVHQSTPAGVYYPEFMLYDQAQNSRTYIDLNRPYYTNQSRISPPGSDLTMQVISNFLPEIAVEGPGATPLVDGSSTVPFGPAAVKSGRAWYDFGGNLEAEFTPAQVTGGGTTQHSGGVLKHHNGGTTNESKSIHQHNHFHPGYNESWSAEVEVKIPSSLDAGAPANHGFVDNGLIVSFTNSSGVLYRFIAGLSIEPDRKYLMYWTVKSPQGTSYYPGSGGEISTTDESGIVRVQYDAATKVLSAESGAGTIASLNLAAANWGMTAADHFDLSVAVITANCPIPASTPVTLDNFKAATLPAPVERTFTITNSGTAPLNLNSMTKDGSHAQDFIIGYYGLPLLAPGDDTTFTASFSPTGVGTRTATLHLSSTDADESPFDIVLTGSGLPGAPSVVTGQAFPVTRTSAALRGLVNDMGTSTSVSFEYGLTTGYGSTVAATPGTVSGGTDQIVGGAITGLLPNTTYHYRVRATNTAGTTLGDDRTFTTLLLDAGDLDSGFTPGVNGEVIAMAVQPDGKILIGGDFSMVGGTARPGFARLNANGALDGLFNPLMGAGINSIALQRDGKILVGGLFTSAGGQTRHRIARFLADGSLDMAFNPDVNGPVNVIVPQEDGRIIIGGLFTQVGGQARVNLARLHEDGSLGSGFNTGLFSYSLSDEVTSIVQQTDGKIIIGGDFTAAGSGSRNRLARISEDGSLDTTFTASADDRVNALVLQADGKVLAGGDFTSVNGIPRQQLVRLNSDGSVDLAFDAALHYDNGGPQPARVNGIALQADGGILVAGLFSEAGGAPRNSLARLSMDGSADFGFTGPASAFALTGVMLQANGGILAGGAVTPTSGFGRVVNGAATQLLEATGINRVQWLCGGTTPEISAVTFEVSTNSGSTWTSLGGQGTRISGGWELTGITTLPASAQIRATARVSGGLGSASSGLLRTVTSYSGFPVPDIAVFNGASTAAADERVDGTTFDFGARVVGGSQTATFTIRNTGSLTLSSIDVGPIGSGDFSYTAPAASSLTSGATATFTVTFAPTGEGIQTRTLHIFSNDPDESVWTIYFTGQGQIPPSITLDPVSAMTGLGQALSLTGAAGGTAVQLQWLCNGSPVAGATAGTLSIGSTALGHAGEWRLRASNGVGTALSKVAHVGVVDLSARNVSIAAGGMLILQVPTAAPRASYRWLRGGVAIPRGINPESQLILPGIASDQGGAYSLQVTMPMPELSPGPPFVMTSGVVNVIVTGGSGGGGGAGPAVPRKPVVNSFEPGPWISGAEVRAVVPAMNSPTRFAIQGLPPGVRLDTRTGQISGRPTTVLQMPKRYELVISASNAAGTSAPLRTSVVVQPLPGYTAGNFQGLITRHETMNASHGGRFQLTVSPLGALTGRLSLGAVAHGFAGKMDPPEVGRDVTATVVIARARPQIPLTLALTIHRLTGELTGTIGGSADITASVEAWHQSADAALRAGSYQVVLRPEAAVMGDARFPQGLGKVRLTVARQGGASWTGRLADGSSITGSSALTLRDSVPVSSFNASLRSSLQGWLQFEAGSRACSGTLDWLRLSPASGFPLHVLEVAPAD